MQQQAKLALAKAIFAVGTDIVTHRDILLFNRAEAHDMAECAAQDAQDATADYRECAAEGDRAGMRDAAVARFNARMLECTLADMSDKLALQLARM